MAAINGFSGSGSINGDPHFNVNGSNFEYQGLADHFYDVLSDNGIKVTDQFVRYSDNANVVGKTGIVIGNDKIEVDAGGHVLINGVAVQNGSYLNGEVVVSNGTTEIKADHYDLAIHDKGDHLDTDIVANGAGSQTDLPSGVWGSVLSNPIEVKNANYGDAFQVQGLFDSTSVASLGDIASLLSQQIAALQYQYAQAVANGPASTSPADQAAYANRLQTLQSTIDTLAKELTSVQGLETPPTVSDDDIQSIQNAAMQSFLDAASKAPDGSDLKTIYNLYKTLAIQAQVPDLASHVDKNAAESDLQTYLQKPDVQAAMLQAIDSATPAVTGKSSAAIVQTLSNYLTSPDTLANLSALRKINPTAANNVVNGIIGQVSFFDPTAAKALLKNYITANINPTNPMLTIANSDPSVFETSVSDAFQVGVSEARFGLGALSNSFTALSKLTPVELQQASQAYAAALQNAATVDPNGAQTSQLVEAWLAADNLPTTVRDALSAFSGKLVASGTFGILSGALATMAVVQDFTGEGNATTSTPWGRVTTAADLMTAIGAASAIKDGIGALSDPIKNLYAILSSSLSSPANAPLVTGALEGVELTNAGAVAAALNASPAISAELEASSLSEASVTEFASAVSDLASSSSSSSGASFFSALENIEQAGGADAALAQLAHDPEIVADLSSGAGSAAGAAAEIEAAGVGLSEAEVLTAAGEISAVAGEALPAVGAAGLSATALVFKGLGALGSAANLLYAAGALDHAITDFENDDAIAGSLDVGSALGLAVSGVAGLGAAAAGTAAAFGAEGALIGAFSGPAAPIVAAVAGLAGFAFGLGSYFYKQNERNQQLDALTSFLQNGVGTGKSYYVP